MLIYLGFFVNEAFLIKKSYMRLSCFSLNAILFKQTQGILRYAKRFLDYSLLRVHPN